MRIPNPRSFSATYKHKPGSQRPWLARYGLALAIYAATIGLSLLLRHFEIRLNLTIPVMLALAAASWFGGRGPGLLVGVLFLITTVIFAPIPLNSTVFQAVVTHTSVFAFYVFLALLISRLRGVMQSLKEERDRLRLAETESARRAREVTALFQFSNSIQHASSMDEVYEAALDAMCATLECDRASILLFDSAGTMRFVACRGLSEEYRTAVEGHSPWDQDEKNAKPFGIYELATADLDDELRSSIDGEGISSLGFIPLLSEERLIGKLMIYFNEPHEFTDSEFEMAMTVGSQIAAGVELKRAQTQLLENEERLRVATATGKVGVWDWQIREDRIEWTDAVYEIHGVDKESFDGRLESFAALVHPADREMVQERISQALAGEVPFDLELRLLRPDGSIRTLFTNAVVIRDVEGPFRMIGATVDITDRLRFEEARRESEIMHRLVEAQESERRRIARDLHDHLGQQMTAMRLQIETLSKQLNDGIDVAAALLEVKQAANQIDRDIGFLSWELRPTELEDLGLIDALRTFVREWSKQYGITAEFQMLSSSLDGHLRLSATVETNLYRIVQEALNNVLKHADADEVNVLLQQGKQDLVLTVEDNGCGFERGSGKLNGHSSRGLGLVGMHERAAVMKGTLEIDSSPNTGTTVIARIPVGLALRDPASKFSLS
jgi:PAS domain S-box-containing protein